MRQLAKKPIIILWIIIVIITIYLLASKGLMFGVDFRGGTSFSIVLEEPVSSEKLSQTASVISSRLDWSGSKNATVTPSGSQYIIAQIAESDPEEISELKANLLRQGEFEATLNSEVLFSGEDIKSIFKDPLKGYGVQEYGDQSISKWTLPFLLSPEAAQRFAEMTFHKCTPIGFDQGSESYDCEKTFFFIDRPKDSIILMDKELYLQEKKVPVSPNAASEYIPIEDIFDELTVPIYTVDSNLTSEQIANLTEDFNSYNKIIVSASVSDSVKNKLSEIGYRIKVIEKPNNQPWIWEVTGLKSIVSITEGIANMSVPTIDSSRFETFSELLISGQAESAEAANERLDNILLILESGSLPIPIESISTESISSFLGDEFLKTSLWIGIFALLSVAIVLSIRYKYLSLSLPILITGTSEILILLGFLSLLNFRLDLAAVAGILATIGTGVDDNIIIIDEVLKNKRKEEIEHKEAINKKVKRAYFIMFAAASTTAATMFPIFGLGLGKLTGFAVTILLGTAIGVFLTRPVYAEIVKRILSKSKTSKA
jgi:preprotein translocase subunit SecD